MRPIRSLLLSVAAYCVIFHASAQGVPREPAPVPMGASQMSVLVDPYWKSNTSKAGLAWETMNGVTGSMFYNDDWQNGYVLLAGNRRAGDIPLRFNVYTNEIYFMLDSQVRVIDPGLPVKEFGFAHSREDPGTMIVFRNGYPAIGKNTTLTFYECIAGSWLTLLKHDTKRISERTSLTKGPEKVINDTETWYVYDSTAGRMTEIRKTRNGLTDALPQYAARIAELIRAKNLKLRTDTDWRMLFTEIKNPAHN